MSLVPCDKGDDSSYDERNGLIAVERCLSFYRSRCADLRNAQTSAL